MVLLRILLVAGMTLCVGVTQAQQTQSPQPPREGQESNEHRRPPPEALAACKSLSSGAACNFTSPRGPESGTCAAPEGKPLACRPTREGKPQGVGIQGAKSNR